MQYTHNTHRARTAFSLIELMVVIAIVAILAAVAVPAYKGYMIKSKVAKGVQAMFSLMDKAEEHWQTKGRFPTQHELAALYGTASTGSIYVFDNPKAVSQYVSEVSASAENYNSCTFSHVHAYLDLVELGLSRDFNSIWISCRVYNISGVVYRTCYYLVRDYNTPTVYLTDNLFPSWYRCTNSTCSNNPGSQMNSGVIQDAGVNYPPSVYSANCS